MDGLELKFVAEFFVDALIKFIFNYKFCTLTKTMAHASILLTWGLAEAKIT